MQNKRGANNGEPTREKNPQASSGRGRLLSYERSRPGFNWDMVPNDKIARLVKAVTAAGCGCVLGVTSDGGAVSITILDGDERIREWPANNEAYDNFLGWCETVIGT